MHHSHIVLGADRFQYLLLHGGSLDDFLIHNLEAHIVDVESDVRGILQFRVEIEKSCSFFCRFRSLYARLEQRWLQ